MIFTGYRMLLSVVLLSFVALNAIALPIENVAITTSYRLPGNVIPSQYEINIDVSKSFINIEKTKEFTGSVKITARTNVANLKKIIMHSANITIAQMQVTQNKKDLYVKHTFEDKQILSIELNEALEKNVDFEIDIVHYTGKLHEDMHGFYISSYLDKTDKKHYVLTTQFQPTHARRAFPCFDEPQYKAKFQLSFVLPDEYKVLSNMNAKSTSTATNVEFPLTPVMSTYLVAFIVHKFEFTPNTDDSYKVWARPDAKKQTKEAAKYVKDIVTSLDKFTDIKYKENMDKMDMAALPDFSAGAMENWGLLTYRETALLVDDELSTKKDIQRVISVIAHEVAHQWFGNLVTLKWWENTWINEGFARYFEYHTTGDVLKDWQMADQFVVEQQQSVFGVDALAKTTPLTLDVNSPTEISSHFGSISYGKGGSVIRMMEHFLGSDIFKKGLQLYLKQNKFNNTVPENLWSEIQTFVNEDSLEYPLKAVMSSWISQPGYPVINVKLDSTGHVDFSQKRFFINANENTEKDEKAQHWYVPISYTTGKDLNFEDRKPKLWLTPKEPAKSIVLQDPDFVIVNIQESGYYRVNYDNKLWEKISEALQGEAGKKIHKINKAQIVDDVLNLARAGLVDYKIAFSVTDFLQKETDYYPWYSALQGFRYLLQRYSDTQDTGKELRTYLKSLMQTLIKDKEFNDVEKEGHVDTLNRVSALEWACNLEHDNCVKQAKEMFQKFKEDQNKNKIPINVRSTVYCTALRNGKKEDWDLLWNRFVGSNSAAEKIGILNALGCSKDEEILRSFLDESIKPNGKIRKQDAYYVFSAVFTGNTIGVDVAFKFLSEKYTQIIKYYNGMNDLEKAVLGLGGRMTDKTKIAEFKKLLEKPEFKTFRDAAIETMEQNIAWSEKYSETIGKILNDKRSDSTGNKGDGDSAAGIIANKYVVVLLGFIAIYFSKLN